MDLLYDALSPLDWKDEPAIWAVDADGKYCTGAFAEYISQITYYTAQQAINYYCVLLKALDKSTDLDYFARLGKRAKIEKLLDYGIFTRDIILTFVPSCTYGPSLASAIEGAMVSPLISQILDEIYKSDTEELSNKKAQIKATAGIYLKNPDGPIGSPDLYSAMSGVIIETHASLTNSITFECCFINNSYFKYTGGIYEKGTWISGKA